jgi:hypothetical protein
MEHFANDEDGYKSWKQSNSKGFILVSHNPPSGQYLTLHRADCGSLNPHDASTKKWTEKYVKICSANRAELEEWTVKKFQTTAPRCGLCVRSGRL